MMFKRLHTTGLNKFHRTLAALLAVVLLLGVPVFSASAETASQFQDLKKTEWYYGETSGAIEADLFKGMSDTEFAPEQSITRAQFVTALARLCKVDVSGYQTNVFADVTPNDWFYNYVSWAYATGVVNGVSADAFDPHTPITRQEMCKALGGALEKVLGKTLTSRGAITFTDQAKIADWASEWVAKCNVAGIFNGDDNGCFNPENIARRYEAACVFFRCFVLYNCNIRVSGFALDFNANTDYYLAQPQSFTNCKITGFEGFKSISVSVEQYASYYPYKKTAYKLGDNLKLGNGRAKVTVTATLPGGSTREYLIALADPNGADYAYSLARIASNNSDVKMYSKPNTSSTVLATFISNSSRVYYLKTEGDWCKVEQLSTGKVGYIKKSELQWEWAEREVPVLYADAINALSAAHPNWTFSFVDVEMTYDKALEKYGAQNAQYFDPIHYLTEDKIFAFLDIDTYDPTTWNDAGIKAIWANEKGFSKADAVNYFNAASQSLLMNPYYIACRAALESGYGTSKYASGKMAGYEGYYNFYGIQCYDSNPDQGMTYAKNRNWNSLFKSIVEGANWIKDQYLDQGATTPYFFRFAGFQNKSYMSDVQAPLKEASILKRAYSDPNAKAHFIIPVYR